MNGQNTAKKITSALSPVYVSMKSNHEGKESRRCWPHDKKTFLLKYAFFIKLGTTFGSKVWFRLLWDSRTFENESQHNFKIKGKYLVFAIQNNNIGAETTSLMLEEGCAYPPNNVKLILTNTYIYKFSRTTRHVQELLELGYVQGGESPWTTICCFCALVCKFLEQHVSSCSR